MKRQSEKALLRGAPRAVAPLAADMMRLGGELAALTSRARELAALAAGRALTDAEAAEAARLEADGARLNRELRALRREFDAASPASRDGAMERPAAPSADRGGSRAIRAPLTLTGPALLAVQLLALGYSPEEIASVRQVTPEEVLGDLRAALAALGATTLRHAIAAARRRNLII